MKEGKAADVGKRRFNAFEHSRQDAMAMVLDNRQQIITDDEGAAGKARAEQLKSLRQMFDMIDSDDSGVLEIYEFRILSKSLGMDLTKKQIEQIFAELDADGGGAIDFDEFVHFYTTQNKGANETVARRMGKELLANLHAMMFNEAINEQKGKNEKHMQQEAQRFEAQVARLEEEEGAKEKAAQDIERLRQEKIAQDKAREAERIAIFEKATAEAFARKLERERQEAAQVEKAREDLAKQIKHEADEQARRDKNMEVARQELQRKAAEHNNKLEQDKAKKKRREKKKEQQRLQKLAMLEEEEKKRLESVKAQQMSVVQRNKEKARIRAERFQKYKQEIAAKADGIHAGVESRLSSLNDRLLERQREREAAARQRAAAFAQKQEVIKQMEEAALQERLGLAWKMQTTQQQSEARRQDGLHLKSEESKLWLETRMAKIKRAQKRQAVLEKQRLSEAEDKGQRMEALSHQRKQFDERKRKLAQEYRVARIKMKHNQKKLLEAKQLERKKRGSSMTKEDETQGVQAAA
eukprot:SAG31_NODE_1719_length_7455_cov_7.529772_3_plen_524_part_00